VAKLETLEKAVQQYGFAKGKRIKLYGKELEIVSDPTNVQGDDVFVEARESVTKDVRQVQVPRNVVEMARKSAILNLFGFVGGERSPYHSVNAFHS